MKRNLMMGRTRQRGAVTLVIALLILVALGIIAFAGTRLVLTQHRISGNSARADAAFAAAEAGVQNAIAYLNANRSVVASTGSGGWLNATTPKWIACASGATALPCGNGSSNLYGTTWKYYGPLPNQQAPNTDYTVQTWLLSNTVGATPQTFPYFACTGLDPTKVVPLVTVPLVNGVNTILNSVPVLNQKNLGLAQSTCLPVNFSQEPPAPWPSSINPSVTVVASAAAATDTVAGGVANVQQVTANTSLFAGLPPAALMVAGTVSLAGDIRIWGNPRPPTVAPMNFSILQLSDVAGLPVSTLLSSTITPIATPIANAINLSFAPLITGVTPAQALAFTWDVTFPLSIWSSATTTFGTGLVNKNNVVGLLGGTLNGLLSGLLSTLNITGLDINNLLNLGGNVSLLSSARTCLPQFDGTPNSACTPLSESILPATTSQVCVLVCLPPVVNQGSLLSLKLPDVQDPVELVSAVAAGLLGGSVPCFPGVVSTPSASCTAGLPPTLFEFTYGYPTAQSSNIQQLATAASDCSSVGSSALYWVSGNCSLSGTIGSATAPVTIITTGNVTLAAGTDFYGVIYQRGSGAKTFAGASSGTRPTVHGAVLSEGNFTGSNNFNIAYDSGTVRAAGFRAGGFAPIPGGWNDALTGP